MVKGGRKFHLPHGENLKELDISQQYGRLSSLLSKWFMVYNVLQEYN